jgi:ABC-type Fe3+ transport system permease subunit
MDWWLWVLLVVIVVAVLAGALAWVQARRRSGGVIAAGRGRGGRRGPR